MASRKPPLAAVVDTNVVAYFLLKTEPFVEEAAGFLRLGWTLFAPASWESELANVVWMAIRAGIIDLSEGCRRLEFASALGLVSIPVKGLWNGALARAVDREHPVYDTLFVELAVRRGLPLLTFDQALLKRFPDVAHRPSAFTSV